MHPHPLPVPPWDMPPFDSGNLFMFIFNGVQVLGGLIWALSYARRERSFIPLALMIGGGICCIHEPLLDVIAHCFLPYSKTWAMFSLYGRPVSYWHPLAYSLFYGMMPAILFVRMRAGMSGNLIVLFMLSVVVFDVVLEGVMVQFGCWTFYGNQPLTIAGMPLWFGAMNCIGVLTAATIVYVFEPVFDGAKAFLLVLWLPIEHVADISIVGWPSWLAVNSEVSGLARQACGIASYLIFALIVTLAIRAIDRRRRMLAPSDAAFQAVFAHA